MRLILYTIVFLFILLMVPLQASNDWMRTTNRMGSESILAQLECLSEITHTKITDGPLCKASERQEFAWKQRESNPPWYVCLGTKVTGNQWTECTKRVKP